jgi:glutathione S-transferase
MTAPDIELLQFPYSHYNEKARWALDFTGITHTRRNLLPGPHMRTMRKLTGQTAVPALRLGDDIIAGSERIIDVLEERFPDPPLYPADQEQRAHALEIQTWFGDKVGPAVRAASFADTLNAKDYVARMFSEGQAGPKRLLYRAMFPMVARLIANGYKVHDADRMEWARNRTREGLDFVVANAGPDGYLVGDKFSVADLTAAAMLAVTAHPPTRRTRPEPRPPGAVAWTDRWAGHDGVDWILDMYRRHRGDPAR